MNSDGTPLVQKVVNSDGSIGTAQVTRKIPVYQLTPVGGDTATVFNYEYRIPIIGPVTLAPFVDAGVNRVSFANQLDLNPARVAMLNAEYPQANFGSRAIVAGDSEKPRVSTGLELQVLMPVVNAPFRLYWAYNLSYVNTAFQAPIVADRSFFPNNATYQGALSTGLFGLPIPYSERHSLFRFSVGRTF